MCFATFHAIIVFLARADIPVDSGFATLAPSIVSPVRMGGKVYASPTPLASSAAPVSYNSARAAVRVSPATAHFSGPLRP
jgi:hypothetical protein